MNYSNYTGEQLIERIDELEMLSSALLKEKEQENKLDFAWVGNLGHWYWNLKTNSVICNKQENYGAGLYYRRSAEDTALSILYGKTASG